jgi:hypothetical protein
MASPEILRPIESLELLPLAEEMSGCEKTVTKMSDGTNIVAAKIFRDRISYGGDEYGEVIDKTTAAKSEFQAYKTLRESPLGIYTPQPHYLLNDAEGNVIGLAVAWIEGENLLDMPWNAPDRLNGEEIKTLSKRILEAKSRGILILDDVISAPNLIIRKGTEPRIAFAECQFFTGSNALTDFNRTIPTTLNDLWRNYRVVGKR